MSRSSIPPKIEERIKTHLEVWRRQSLSREKDKIGKELAPFITISRQFGCNAHVLAKSIEKKLNENKPEVPWTVYDRDLLEILSDREDITAELIQSLTKHTRSEFEEWMVYVFSGAPSQMKAFRQLARTIRALASIGYCIIVGRGGAVITRTLPGGLHIRIVASKEWRINNLKQYPAKVKYANSDALMQNDEEREGFVRKYLDVDLNDPVHFHMVLNNEKLAISDQVNAVLSLLDKRKRIIDLNETEISLA